MLQDPMVTNLAMSYGRDFVGKGQEEIKKNIDKYVSISQLKVSAIFRILQVLYLRMSSIGAIDNYTSNCVKFNVRTALGSIIIQRLFIVRVRRGTPVHEAR